MISFTITLKQVQFHSLFAPVWCYIYICKCRVKILEETLLIPIKVYCVSYVFFLQVKKNDYHKVNDVVPNFVWVCKL